MMKPILGRNKNGGAGRTVADNAVLDQIKILNESLLSMQKSLEMTNKRIDDMTRALENQSGASGGEQGAFLRAKTERQTELGEQALSTDMPSGMLKSGNRQLQQIHGRYREILAMLINNGFHTYGQIAQNLGISQSRARAYIADLKNVYNVPLKQVRDPEGYKIGVDIRFVDEILASK